MSARSRVYALALLAVFIASCYREPNDTSSGVLLEDRHSSWLDFGAPTTRFDGSGSSLLTVDGWGRAEKVSEGNPEQYEAWVVGETAVLRFVGNAASELDLFASLSPYSYDGAPQQVLVVELAGETAAQVELDPGWQDIRVRLPSRLWHSGLNEILLRFTYSASPAEVGEGKDKRRLSARFRLLSLLPRGVGEERPFLNAHRLDPSRRELTLPVHAAAAFPLPASTDIRARVGQVTTTCADCELSVELRTSDGTFRQLWSQSESQETEPLIRVQTAPEGVSMLLFRVRRNAATVPERAAPPGTVTVTLGQPFIERQPIERVTSREAPSVFIYVIDTLRADALEAYGSSRKTSPRILEFAREAVVYEQAWTPSAWTLPATVSLMTGVYPRRHGVMQGDVRLSAAGPATLAEILAQNGYATLGFSQSFVAGPRFGLDTGFDRFVLSNQLNNPRLRSQELRAFFLQELVTRAIHEPMFGYFHTVDPHAPYEPVGRGADFAVETPGTMRQEQYRPQDFMSSADPVNPADIEHMKALYEGEVYYADEQFGRLVDLLRHLDLYDRSLVILVSDHGEEFGEHGGFDHGRTLFEEMLRVPLIVKYPRSEYAGFRVSPRVSTLDVVPTVFEVLGITGSVDSDGRPLIPALLDSVTSERREIFSEVNPIGNNQSVEVDYQALARGTLKCIHNPLERDQFDNPAPAWVTFDLSADPEELSPVPNDSARAQRCQQVLRAWLETDHSMLGEGEPVTEEALEGLRALGYIN